MTRAEEIHELALLKARNAVSDETYIARINAAPDNGGDQLMQHAEFVFRRDDPAGLVARVCP